MRIVSISSSRADVGILQPVWRALIDAGVDLHVILTGMHRAAGAPPVEFDGLAVGVHVVGSDLGGCADDTAARAMGDILAGCGAVYSDLRPDLVLAIGDRLDMLPAVAATLPFNIPVAHLHGGEITEGAVDDRIRHAITKLAHQHLVSCESAAQRLRDMGEDPERIVVTGAPGLDTLLAAPVMERVAFLTEVGLASVAGAQDIFLLATVHPETNADDPSAPMTAVLGALDEMKLPVLFTAPNSDPGGAAIKEQLTQWARGKAFVRLVESLGSRLYPNALRYAAAMVGNSSSGIIEAGMFGLPVVDVGDRQKGRDRGENVIGAANNARVIVAAIAKARSSQISGGGIFGDGKSAARIVECLTRLPARANLLRKSSRLEFRASGAARSSLAGPQN